MAGAEQVDQQLLAALRKQRSGAKLTQRDEIALRRYEKQQREKYGPAYLRELPKKDALTSLGVSNKTALEHADRFDVPWEPHAKTVNILAVARRLWEIVTQHSAVISKAIKTEQRKAGVEEFLGDVAATATDWQEECFKEKALELRDKRKVREGELLDAKAFEAIAFPAADGFRDFVERLGKRYGPDAQKMALAWWRDWETSVTRVLADDDGGSR